MSLGHLDMYKGIPDMIRHDQTYQHVYKEQQNQSWAEERRKKAGPKQVDLRRKK